MKFRTEVSIPEWPWRIEPHHRLLFVGSCFADNIGSRFADNQFRTVVNPFGTMYNPVSVVHTLQRMGNERLARFDVCFITLGTNHVYRLNATGEIVDNCEKRPARLFTEESLSVGQCEEALRGCVDLLREANSAMRVVFTVSPIRYAKYGFHGSQLSKAALLLAVDSVVAGSPERCTYFPAYEIVNDELRDYRFYAADMLHPSPQAVDYIWQLMTFHLLSPAARQFLDEWQPIRQALNHQPFNPDSPQYQAFAQQTRQRLADFRSKYGLQPDDDLPGPQR